MSLFLRLLGLEKRSSSGSELERLLLSANQTASGLTVSPENALRCATVAACCRVLSDAIAQLPLAVYRRLPDGGKERADDHPLHRLLHDAPNGWTTSAEWRGTAMHQLSLVGESFSWIGRARGQVVELVNCPSGSIQVEWDCMTGEPSFTATLADGTRRPVDKADLLWLRLPSPDPRKPLSLVEKAKEAIALSIAMERYAANLFARGARPAGVLKAGARLSPEAIARLRASLEAMHSGAESGRTLVLEENMTFEALQFASTDLQFLELRRHQIAEIARVWRVPLHLLQELERATHNNAESMGQQFLSLSVLPWLTLWRQALERDLLSGDERGEYFVEFQTDDLARADLSSRMQAYSTAIQTGILNPNEVRSLENRPPYAGGEAFMKPLNMADAGGVNG